MRKVPLSSRHSPPVESDINLTWLIEFQRPVHPALVVVDQEMGQGLLPILQ